MASTAQEHRQLAIKLALQRVDQDLGQHTTMGDQIGVLDEIIEQNKLKIREQPKGGPVGEEIDMTSKKYREVLGQVARQHGTKSKEKSASVKDLFMKGSKILKQAYRTKLGLTPAATIRAEEDEDGSATPEEAVPQQDQTLQSKPAVKGKANVRPAEEDISQESQRVDAESQPFSNASLAMVSAAASATTPVTGQKRGPSAEMMNESNIAHAGKKAKTATSSSPMISQEARQPPEQPDHDLTKRSWSLTNVREPDGGASVNVTKQAGTSNATSIQNAAWIPKQNLKRGAPEADQARPHKQSRTGALLNSAVSQNDADMSSATTIQNAAWIPKQNLKRVAPEADQARPHKQARTGELLNPVVSENNANNFDASQQKPIERGETSEVQARTEPDARADREKQYWKHAFGLRSFNDKEVDNGCKMVWHKVHGASRRLIYPLGLEGKGTAKLVLKPDPELKELYETVFGEKWLERSSSMLSAGKINNVGLMEAYVSAAVHNMVMSPRVPWTNAKDIRALIPDHDFNEIKELLGVFNQQMLNAHWMLWQAGINKMTSPEFQEEVIRPHAQKLAHRFLAVINTQLEYLGASKMKGESDEWRKDRVEDFTELFFTALVLKGQMDAAPNYYRITRPISGNLLDREMMEDLHRNNNQADKLEIVWGLTPTVERRRTPVSDWAVAHQAVVYSRLIED